MKKKLKKKIEGFIKSIETTEYNLKSNFYYWTKIPEIFNIFKEKICSEVFAKNSNFLWLFDDPLSKQYQNIKNKSLMAAEKIFDTYSNIDLKPELIRRFSNESKCPDDEMLIMFASDELSLEEESSIKKHILICDKCSYEVAVLQSVINEPMSTYTDKPFAIPSIVKEAMEKEFADIKKSHKSFSEKVSEKLQKGKKYIKDVSSAIASELIIQISSLWEPPLVGQLVTASDITKQKHKFLIERGDITISCSWAPEDENDPAYLYLKWKANIAEECELWARFENPETHNILSEICLGTSLTGEDSFTSSDLGFDPSATRWACFYYIG